MEKCRGLTPEQFTRPFPIGPADHGGLHAILTHIIGAMRRWADRIGGAGGARPIRPPMEHWRPGHEPRPRPFTPDELIVLLEDAHEDLTRVIAEVVAQGHAGLSRDVMLVFQTPRGPQSHTFTAGAAIASAAVHGHYHRAQCMNILRQLGVPGVSDALPSLDVVDWQDAEE